MLADKVSCRIPVLDDVKPFLHFALGLAGGKIVAKKNGLLCLAQFGQRLVRRVRAVIRVVSLQNSFRARRAALEGYFALKQTSASLLAR